MLISLPIYRWAFIPEWMLQPRLTWIFSSISNIIRTLFKSLLYYKLEWVPRCPFVLYNLQSVATSDVNRVFGKILHVVREQWKARFAQL